MISLQGEIKRRIDRNLDRLLEPLYSFASAKIMSPDWPGDFYGREMLSLVSLLQAETGDKKRQQMALERLEELYEGLDQCLNEKGYFGPVHEDGLVDEQQLAGNSWFLRALIEFYRYSGKKDALGKARRVMENLFVPASYHYADYPLGERKKGEVSGSLVDETNGWKLSSDIGAAFLAFDGFSAGYEAMKEPAFLDACERVLSRFQGIDFVAKQFQTHATLTCCRGIYRMYQATGEEHYLAWAQKVFHLYCTQGMSEDYANINWFGRPETWTEPCCIVDSWILAKELYTSTKDERYLKLYHRILANSIRTFQRDNGGAGCSTCATTATNHTMKEWMYEAYFCCTMRLGEGFKEIQSFAVQKQEGGYEVLNPFDLRYQDEDVSFRLEGDVYHHHKVKVIVSKMNIPFMISLALPTYAVAQGKEGNVTLKIDHPGTYEVPVKVMRYEEDGFHYYGDMILAKKDGSSSYGKLVDSSTLSKDELQKVVQKLK